MPLAPARTRVRTSHFDAVRNLHYAKPIMRGWSHLVWFGLCLTLGPWAIASRGGGAERVLALTVYVTAISGLFGVSALYHCGTWSAAAARRWQRADHVMILFMIAGTATPTFLLTGLGRLGVIATISMWTLALGVAGLHLRRMQVPERVIGAAFLVLGWGGALVIPTVWIRSGAPAALMIVGGGLLFTGGAIGYHRRSPDPFPTVFGYHEVFHACVCAAATLQFIAIMGYIA